MLPTQFWFIWPNSFREDFLEIDQSEIRIACGGHVCQQIGTKCAIFIEDMPQMLPTMFRFIWQNGYRGEDFQKSTNQKQECRWQPCLITKQDGMCDLYRGTSIYVSYQVSVHLAKRCKRRRFLEIDQSEARIDCGGHVCQRIGRHEQSLQMTFHRCFLPSFKSFGQAVSEEKIFRN